MLNVPICSNIYIYIYGMYKYIQFYVYIYTHIIYTYNPSERIKHRIWTMLGNLKAKPSTAFTWTLDLGNRSSSNDLRRWGSVDPCFETTCEKNSWEMWVGKYREIVAYNILQWSRKQVGNFGKKRLLLTMIEKKNTWNVPKNRWGWHIHFGTLVGMLNKGLENTDIDQRPRII